MGGDARSIGLSLAVVRGLRGLAFARLVSRELIADNFDRSLAEIRRRAEAAKATGP